VTFTPTDTTDYNTATASVTITVNNPPEIIVVESPPVEIPTINPNVPENVQVENTNITGFTIDTLVAAENVRITVQQLTDRPATIAIGAPGAVYQYFNVVVDNLSDAQIENVVINFRVERSWIAENGTDISTITLNRYDPVAGSWTSLPTTYLSEDDNYAYFSAVSPGLSVFGISGLPTTTTTAPPTTTTTTSTTAPIATTTTPAGTPWAWIGVGIAIVVVIAVVALVLKGRGK
jgi:PGF-pre-PGF domain-containing protein